MSPLLCGSRRGAFCSTSAFLNMLCIFVTLFTTIQIIYHSFSSVAGGKRWYLKRADGLIGVQALIESLHPNCFNTMNSRKYRQDCSPTSRSITQRMKVDVLPLLITGLGGGGTHAVANRLLSSGLDLPHEEIGALGAVSWFYAVNDKIGNTTVDYPHRAKLRYHSYYSPRFQNVFHLVRCPMRHISSFTSHLNESYEFVRHHMRLQLQLQEVTGRKWRPGVVIRARQALLDRPFPACGRGDSCNLHFAALAWYFWNSHVHTYADVTFRIETDIEKLEKAAKEVAESVPVVKRTKYSQPRPMKPWWGHPRNGTTAYNSSPAHKLHKEYTLQDIAKVDRELSVEIAKLSAVLGYEVSGLPARKGDSGSLESSSYSKEYENKLSSSVSTGDYAIEISCPDDTFLTKR